MPTKDEIYAEITRTLTELFEAPTASLSPSTRLVEDLDLDSIDAIEMAVQLEKRIGYDFKGPELRAVRTIQDIVDHVHARQHAGVPVLADVAESARG